MLLTWKANEMTVNFPQVEYLNQLERMEHATLPSWLAKALPHESPSENPAGTIDCLAQLLTAKKAVWQAAVDTALAADELRRYQKYAKPGQPSAHIVQLRQKQAAARQASNISRQSYIKAATAFVREARLEVPPRVTIDAFITGWIDRYLR